MKISTSTIILGATLLLPTLSFASSRSGTVETCAERLFSGLDVQFQEVNDTETFALYLTTAPRDEVTYGRLVALDDCRILQTVGSRAGCSLGEGGCYPAQSVRSAHFTKTRYGNTLADFSDGVGPSADLCGRMHPGDYLSTEPIDLPSRIPARYAHPWYVEQIQGTTITFRSTYSSDTPVQLDIGSSIDSAYPVSSLRMSNGGATTGVFAVKLKSGKTRYFGHFGSYIEFYRQVDNKFSEHRDEFCRL